MGCAGGEEIMPTDIKRNNSKQSRLKAVGRVRRAHVQGMHALPVHIHARKLEYNAECRVQSVLCACMSASNR